MIRPPTRRVLAVVAMLAAAVGVWQLASGIWIPAKAALAQVLLDRAWLEAGAGTQRPKPWPWADTWPVARLDFPHASRSMVVLAGATGRTLAFGPGHHDGTPRPGRPGRALVSGHRDTHFRLLESIRPGDAVIAETPAGKRITYRVTGREVVDGRRARLPATGDGRSMTLVTCYPFDALLPGGPLRLLVHAEAEPPLPPSS